MYKLQIVVLFALSIFIAGCDGDEDDGPNIKSLELTLSKSRIVGDNTDFAKVSVVNQDGRSVMEYITIYYDGETVSGDKIASPTPSVSTVYAMYNNIKSNEEEIEVVEDKNLKFNKNVLLEQYTGTWCGWCPRAIYQISNLQKTDNRVVHVAYHLSDEMTYSLNSTLFQSFGFTGIPTVHADRNIEWKGEPSEIKPLHTPSRIGISMEVTGNIALVTANINIMFGYDFAENLELSVYLLNDSLIANQANYYDTDPSSPYYKAGSIMGNFVHRNVMIKSGTDIFGDAIPSASVDIGSIYAKEIKFTNFSCSEIKKMIVIAFVTYSSGSRTDEVLNCIKARVGEKLEFVYEDS
ncbi:MAG: Omp28-related outer membrane protein [Bacteroidia bacterium]|nr:Omp28-related outer membrane protein [Bacteroidia bacterium]